MKILWTDGSASPNPGPGGFAVLENGKPVRLGSEKDSTNIRMEGFAMIAAIEDVVWRVEIKIKVTRLQAHSSRVLLCICKQIESISHDVVFAKRKLKSIDIRFHFEFLVEIIPEVECARC